MNAFFYVSKIGWLLVAPSSVLVLLAVLGVVFFLLRWRAWSLRLLLASAALTLVFALAPVGDLMLRPLEQRFPAYPHCSSFIQPVAGVIVLGGGLSSRTLGTRTNEDLGEAADRVRFAAALGRTHPDAPILVSGGEIVSRKGARSEAAGTADLLVEMGVAPARIMAEAGSRTTAENAALAVAKAAGRKGSWLLVTSAFHMPRAMGAFRKAGVDVIAAPTDWRIDDQAPWLTTSASDRLGKVDLAFKEYLGLAGYWAAGRSSELFPGPESDGPCIPGSINAAPTAAPSSRSSPVQPPATEPG
jgi:uncharacterized SAM-binding protein YcdF (DUF218 family)